MRQKTILILLKSFFIFQIGLSIPLHITVPLGTVTEVLCEADSELDIFTCRIIENFNTDNAIYHIAVVDEVFRGSIADTVQLAVRHVGYTGPKKTKLLLGSEHLIFGIRQKNGHYLTRYGRTGHSGILNVRIIEAYKEIEARSKKYLSCLRDYYSKVKENYTGFIKLEAEGYFRTTGYLKNGLPDGEWVHHDLTYDLDIDYKTTTNYKAGRLHGESYKSYYQNGHRHIPIVQEYNEGKETSRKIYQDQELIKKSEFTYQGSMTYTTYIEYEDKKVSSLITSIYIKNIFAYTISKHGLYFHNPNTSYSRPERAQGNYYRGAKIGQWTYFNQTGEIDSIETYIKPKETADSTFTLYHENGSINIQGQIINDLKEGLWQEYNLDGQLVNEVRYDKDKYSGTTWTSKEQSRAYYQSLCHGFTKTYNNNGDLTSIREYKEDIQHGQYISYYSSNQIQYRGEYKNGFAIGVHNKYQKDGGLMEGRIYDDRGSLVQLRTYKEGRLITEGQYLNGYKSGHWKQYGDDGSYESEFYPEDLEILMGYYGIEDEIITIEKYDPKVHSRQSK